MTPTAPDQDSELRQLALRAALGEAARRRGRLVVLVVVALVLVGVGEFTADTWLATDGSDRILLAGALAPLRVMQGEWWRLCTAPWLHADPWHLAFNCFGLVAIGRPVEAIFGRSRFWLIFAVSGLSGAACTLLGAMSGQAAVPPMVRLATASMSVGASGSVFGLMAAMLAFGLKIWPRVRGDLRRSLVLVPAGVLLAMLALGAVGDPRVDQAAHWGGAAGGLAMGLTLQPALLMRDRRRDVQLGAIRLLAWGLAFLVPASLALVWLNLEHQRPLPRIRTLPPRGSPTLVLPRDLPIGVWQRGECQVRAVDPDWALKFDRELCWQLPLDGTLILGRRDRLLTLDDDDLVVMRKSAHLGLFLRRQPGVLLAPVGPQLIYVAEAPDALLPVVAEALQGLAPQPDAVAVDAPWSASEPDWWRSFGAR